MLANAAGFLAVLLWMGALSSPLPAQQPADIQPAHPGSIRYLEAVGGSERLVRVEPIETVPEALRYGTMPDGQRLPVVEVVAIMVETASPDGTPARRIAEILEYGPGRQLLRRTAAAR